MTDEHAERKKKMALKWIKGDSGHTYLCPADKLEKLDNPTEDQLKAICVDESENPQND
jgi:ribonuclease HI